MSLSAIGRAPETARIDSRKCFMPEEFTPLSHTRSYRLLTPEQRLRYNQLNALYFNEQIMFFETVVGRGVLGSLLRDSWPDRLAETLQRFWTEERAHTEMFRQLNRRCAPGLYGSVDFHFIRVPRGWMELLNGAAHRPRAFPMFLWLMLLQEERSLFFSKEFIRQGDRLEPTFVATHRAHLADEVDHVRWDEELLDLLWCRASRVLRAVNASLFCWMLGEFFNTPKRGQWHVVGELLREFPELRDEEPEIRRQLRALRDSEPYHLSLYSRRIVPRTFARLDAWPEFRTLERKLPGYRIASEEPL
jgi:hypothetical protein